jgi:hypothetical protein
MLKSRKKKEQLRKCIRESLLWHQGFTKSYQIKYLYDDYDYWCARQAHKILHPNTPDEYYLVIK